MEARLAEQTTGLRALEALMSEPGESTAAQVAERERMEEARAGEATELDVARDRIAALEDQVEVWSEALVAARDRILVLEDRMSRSSAAIAETTTAREALSAELHVARAGLADLATRLAAELSELGQSAAVRASELARVRQARAEDGTALTAAADRIALLEGQVASVMELLSATRDEREGLSAELAAARGRMAALEVEVASASERSVSAEGRIGELESELSAAAARRAALAGQVAELQAGTIARTERTPEPPSVESTAVPAAGRRIGEPRAAAEEAPLPTASSAPATEEVTGLVGDHSGPAVGKQAAVTLVREWAKAWSSQDPESYLSFYASSFEPGGGLGRGAWEERRRLLLRRPEFIRVEVEGLEVELAAGGRARASFRQRYESDSRRLSTIKTLDLVQENGGWRIERERVGG